MSRMQILPILVLAACACSSKEPSSAEPGATAPAGSAAPSPAPPPAPALPPADAALPSPASAAAIEMMAAGTYNLDSMVQPRMPVIEVIGAAEDPSDQGHDHPRQTKTYCGAKAKAAIVATARAMVDRAKKYGTAIECDLTYVDKPDPAFAAVPATSKSAARPGHQWRYAVCTSHGVAEYDRTIQLYYMAPSMNIVGILDTEVGSSLGDEDLATLDGELMAEILRCP